MIRALTVMGHGVNLLPHYIRHYEQFVDEINIVVYENEKQPTIYSDTLDIINGLDNVKIVKVVKERVFDWEKVTNLYNLIKSKYPKDWWVISDIDEFHLYPNDDLKSLIKECETNNWDIVRGGFIDRIGNNGEFVNIVPDINIFEQMPYMGFFRYPMSRACPNKICVMKGYVELTHGQHYARIDGQTTWKWQGWSHPLIAPYEKYSVQVHHFKWDKTSIERLVSVAQINKEYSYSDEYLTMFKSLKKNNFKIDIKNPEYFFEKSINFYTFNEYKQWNKLLRKIVSI
jgi:hypothetical protein